MNQLTGTPASPGFASGPCFWLNTQALEVHRATIADPQVELSRLERALEDARGQIQVIFEAAQKNVGQEEAAIFEAHLLFLEDPELLDRVRSRIQEEHLNVEAAWADATEIYAGTLEAMENEYFAARAADVRDVGRRVLRLLYHLPEDNLGRMPGAAVILARDLTPSDTVRLDKKRVLAFCTVEGGPTSHTAILAKSLGLPAVVGVGKPLLDVPQGADVLVDGELGSITVDPDEKAHMEFEARKAGLQVRSAAELSSALDPAVTIDGHRVEVVANIGGVADARSALRFGAEGVGLFRTEFLYLERQSAPDEEEQFQAYAAVMEVMGNRPVVVRTMDIGGDKELSYLNLGNEANPFLGYRAIRISLAEPEIFKDQLKALLRAAVGRDLRIMFPMIATLAEVRQARALLGEARQQLEISGQPVPTRLQTGIMVEIPSVVAMADRFAQEVDFFSIGTNDLTQYTFAAERTNERVSYLSDACHPAILRQIKTVIQVAHAQGIWVGVCGELAGDTDAVPILLGLGLDEFSMASPAIPHAKAVIRNWSLEGAQSLAQQTLDLESGAEVRAFVRKAFPR